MKEIINFHNMDKSNYFEIDCQYQFDILFETRYCNQCKIQTYIKEYYIFSQ